MSFTTRRILTDSTGSQYRIPNSLRFRSSASAYLSRTPTVTSGNDKWTYSAWVKLSNVSSNFPLIAAIKNFPSDPGRWEQGVTIGPNGVYVYGFTNTNIYGGGYRWLRQFGGAFRDPSAWYHVVVWFDANNTTLNQRVRVWVNNVELTTIINSNDSNWGEGLYINSTDAAQMSIAAGYQSWNGGLPVYFYEGYVAEINMISSSLVSPLAFGNFSATTGVWTPARYTGTYGTNGFYLKFTDTSSNTATGIGKDFSGNGNNWTPNNISLTAGATYDSMIDTPTPYDDGGYGRGNYAVLNPVDKSPSMVLSDGNLSFASALAGDFGVRGTMFVSSGKWYFEGSQPTYAVGQLFGVANASQDLNQGNQHTTSSNLWAFEPSSGGKCNGGTTTYGNAAAGNSVIGVALDLDAGKIWFSVNGTWQASGNPVTGINAAFSTLQGMTLAPYYYDGRSDSTPTGYLNFGQRPFAYTPPAGFKTLCTQNLPTPAIINPAQYMAATTYAGNGSTQTIANTVNNRSFQPDLVWIKGRSAATDHALYDSVRGATKDLVSNSTAAETTQATGLTTFGSNGFSIGSLAKLNTNAQTYVAWQWKAGDSTVTNTAGTITSQVDANPTAGFSIVSYTGNGIAGATIGHGSGVAPKMLIVKQTNASANSWGVYHSGLTSAAYGLILEGTNAQFTTTFWNNTAPALNVFSVGGAGTGTTNNNGSAYIAYCFAEVDGFSKFGSYTGNGSTDGVFCYTGFRPKWVMIKRTDLANMDWVILDAAREPFNDATQLSLLANSNVVEFDSVEVNGYPHFFSNGFKLRGSSNAVNASGGSYIFAAFAEAPFKYALAR